MAQKGVRTREAVLMEVTEFVVGRLEDMIEAHGPDFTYALAKDILWYLRLKNGMYVANTTEGRFISDIESLVEDEDCLNSSDMRFVFSEILLYISSRINVELGQVVDAENKKHSSLIQRKKRRLT